MDSNSMETSNDLQPVGSVKNRGVAPTTWRQIPHGNKLHAHRTVTRKFDNQGNIRCKGLYLLLEGDTPVPGRAVSIYLNRFGEPIGWEVK